MDHYQLAAYIDHTLLKPEAGKDAVSELCSEARQYRFAAVCVLPFYIPLAVEALAGSRVKVATVIGFPLGCSHTEAKVEEALQAVHVGAEELDMVINIAAAVDGDWQTVKRDLAAVVKAAGAVPLKAIIETCYLNRKQKIEAAETAVAAGAAFVKTSTGFGKGGATLADIRLIREAIGEKAKIKASGGIRTYADALAFIDAGAHRLGTSAGVTIIEEA